MKIFKRHHSTILLILIFTILVYSNSFDAAWHFDDVHNITKNQRIQITELSWEQLSKSIYTIKDKDNGGEIVDRPVARISFALNWYFGQSSVFGYHLVNVAIHLMNGCLIYFIILQLFSTPLLKNNESGIACFVAGLSACLWAVHPIQVQGVTYIVQRMASLATMFYLLGIFFYLKGRSTQGTRAGLFFLLSLSAYTLAVGSKQNAVMMPFSLLLIEIIFLDFKIRRVNHSLILLFFLLFVTPLFLLLSGNEIEFLTNLYKERSFSPFQRLITEPRVIWFYLLQIFYPIESRFSIAHEFEVSTSFFDPMSTIFAVFFLTVLAAGAMVFYKKTPLVSFAVLFFLINHIVESSILPMEIVFEHRNYLPSAFLFLPVSMGVHRLILYYRERNRLLSMLIAFSTACILIFIGLGAYARNLTWKTDEALWHDAMVKAPGNSRPYQNYSFALLTAPGGEEKYDKILELNETSINKTESGTKKRKLVTAHNNIASTLSIKKKYPEAIEHYKKVLELRHFNKAISGLTMNYLRIGENEKALETIKKSTSRNLSDINLLSLAYIKNNSPDKALEILKEVQKKDLDNYSTLRNFAAANKLKNKTEKARYYLNQLIQKHPRAIYGYVYMVDLCLTSGQVDCQGVYGKQLIEKFPLQAVFSFMETVKNDKLYHDIQIQGVLDCLEKLMAREYAEKKRAIFEG